MPKINSLNNIKAALRGDIHMSSQKNTKEEFVSVIGAGNMGTGIALKYASSGFLVSLIDQSVASLEKSKIFIEKSLNQGVTRGIFTKDMGEDIKKRLKLSTDFTLTKSSRLIVEAIFEDLNKKRNLFKILEDNCEDAILASNTSSLLISDLQKGLKKPERLLGLHYFFPPAKNKLVELIAGASSNKDCLLEARQIQEQIGKTVIFSKDSPGFIVNRFFVPWLNEAMRIVQDGEANMVSVDHACRAFFNIGMGPFELMNTTGPAITYHACRSLAQHLGDFYAPCPLINHVLENNTLFKPDGEIDENKSDQIIKRIMTIVSEICQRMVYEEKVTTSEDTDLGARVGLSWKKGPFEIMRSGH